MVCIRCRQKVDEVEEDTCKACMSYLCYAAKSSRKKDDPTLREEQAINAFLARMLSQEESSSVADASKESSVTGASSSVSTPADEQLYDSDDDIPPLHMLTPLQLEQLGWRLSSNGSTLIEQPWLAEPELAEIWLAELFPKYLRRRQASVSKAQASQSSNS